MRTLGLEAWHHEAHSQHMHGVDEGGIGSVIAFLMQSCLSGLLLFMPLNFIFLNQRKTNFSLVGTCGGILLS